MTQATSFALRPLRLGALAGDLPIFRYDSTSVSRGYIIALPTRQGALVESNGATEPRQVW